MEENYDIDPSRRRWRVRQGKWTWKPMRLWDALETAKRQLWGATEPVTIEPCILPLKYGQKRKTGQA